MKLQRPRPADTAAILLFVVVVAAMIGLAECSTTDWAPRAAPGSPLSGLERR